MTLTRRTTALLVVALVLGVAAALAVGLSLTGDDSQASTEVAPIPAYDLAADTGDAEAAATDELLAADPARQQPILDTFESKNPFRAIYTPASSGGTSGDTNGTNDTGDDGSNEPSGAKIKVNGAAFTVKVGDKVPSNKQFTITDINSADVVFSLPEGQEFEDGSTSVTVGVGEAVKVTNKDDGKSYTLAVTAIVFQTSGGGGSGGGSTSGHTFSALSISSVDGVTVCTIKVNGQTYSDKKIGAVIDTDAGQVKIVAISEAAQSVTVLYGDVTLVLHVGQSLVK
jgi:hypothetical protein